MRIFRLTPDARSHPNKALIRVLTNTTLIDMYKLVGIRGLNSKILFIWTHDSLWNFRIVTKKPIMKWAEQNLLLSDLTIGILNDLKFNLVKLIFLKKSLSVSCIQANEPDWNVSSITFSISKCKFHHGSRLTKRINLLFWLLTIVFKSCFVSVILHICRNALKVNTTTWRGNDFIAQVNICVSCILTVIYSGI